MKHPHMALVGKERVKAYRPVFNLRREGRKLENHEIKEEDRGAYRIGPTPNRCDQEMPLETQEPIRQGVEGALYNASQHLQTQTLELLYPLLTEQCFMDGHVERP
ncbi:hypothetical protein HAX54_034852 [Datura stramonium]|uniref:Uncharacterized protein n=1 Tax=Datura stramonium TaxID=4076 RepID=A0ABS8VHS2_DATST|nr:hypothetical protein [Datura stramonium]